jgi:hypothetical protein
MRSSGQRFPKWNACFLDQSTSRARTIAGEAGFFTLTQCGERPRPVWSITMLSIPALPSIMPLGGPGVGYGTFRRGGDLGLREASWSGKILIHGSCR